MKFIVTKPNCTCANADCFEIVEVDPLPSLGMEAAKDALIFQFSKDWKSDVKVRTYEEVAKDVMASDCEIAAVVKIFLKQA